MTLDKKEVINEIQYTTLIGKDIEITKSKNEIQVGIKGKIVNETANFFEILQKPSTIKILKQNITFKLMHKSKALYIDGRFLIGNITHRIKKIK